MRIRPYAFLFGVLLTSLCAAPFSGVSAAEERRIESKGTSIESRGPQKPGGAAIILSCKDGTVGFTIQWNKKMGAPGRYVRHVFLPTDLGDTHILLKVLPGGTSTGIIDNDLQAKSLIKFLVDTIGPSGGMQVLALPRDGDRRKATWASQVFGAAEFAKEAQAVADQCNWDMAKPLEKTFRMVQAGEPYKDRD